MKEYMSACEASCNRGVSESRVHKLCQAERILGPEHFGRSWAIPDDAAKSAAPRRLRKTEAQLLPEDAKDTRS